MLQFETERPGTVRRQPDADDGNAPGRAKIERPKKLAGKDHRSLALPFTVTVHTLERVTKMQDDLGTTVGQHRLGVGHLARVAVERPHAVHDWRQYGSGHVFPVDH